MTRRYLPALALVIAIPLLVWFLVITNERINVVNQVRREQREVREKKADEHIKILESYSKDYFGNVTIFEVNGRKFITINGDTLPYVDVNSSK